MHRRTLPRRSRRVGALLLSACLLAAHAIAPSGALGAVKGAPGSATARVAATSEHGASSLEDAAAKAGSTGRAVAMSLIGLALAVAATVLAFRRDFKEAAGVFAVGIVAILLATPTGVALLKDTVASLFSGP
jgi:hypothetical protein